MTDLQTERKEQDRWQRRLRARRLDPLMDRMVTNEFLPEKEMEANLLEKIQFILRHCEHFVPYYADTFRKAGFRPDELRSLRDLTGLPILTKETVKEEFGRLRASSLPPGHKVTGATRTSGSTGQPTEILQTNANGRMYGLLVQRQLRWARFDPGGTLGVLRIRSEKGDRAIQVDNSKAYRFRGWQYLGSIFESGDCYGFPHDMEVEEQIDWLNELEPDYLIAMPGILEQLAFGSASHPMTASLKGIGAYGQMMTSGMRCRVENTFGLPVFTRYGLNEIGLAALRCEEGGRYHVHIEHCFVEVTDAEGQPCRPGETGHVLVTGFRNAAMPLIRYDTGDLATCVEGPCPCGRTLPTFGEITGRYRRVAFLPPGVWKCWAAVEEAMYDMPSELSVSLKQFQLYHHRDGTFTLKLAVSAPLDEEFHRRIREKWLQEAEDEPPLLRIDEMETIPSRDQRKPENFVSDFFPAPDSDEAPPTLSPGN